jgi:predicted RNA binding protein YcfA (HicA-like mRNA interferase family)
MPLKYKDLIPILKAEWFVFQHQTGSHQRYSHITTNIKTTIPFHGELKPKTAKSILTDIAKANNTVTKALLIKYTIKL